MGHIKSIDGDFNAGDAKFCILAGRFNSFIVERLVEGAVDALVRHGTSRENIEIIRVPGAYEMPISAQRIAQTGIDQALEVNHLDALIAPTRASAWLTDHINGDQSIGISSSSLAAVSGYASITVPAGDVSGLPIGLSFIGAAFSDASLIQLAYAFEQAGYRRKPPPEASKR